MTIKHFVTQIAFWPLSWLTWSLLADSAGLKFHGYPRGIQPQSVSGTLSSWEKLVFTTVLPPLREINAFATTV